MKEIKIPAEVYSRCSGYFRPVNQWNPGKREEKRERKEARIEEVKLALTEKIR